MKRSITCSSEAETKNLAAKLVKEVLETQSEHPAVLLLSGELGAGKTTFVQGFLRALGVEDTVASPTFVLMRKYELPNAGHYTYAYHIDAYRLTDELMNQGTDEQKNKMTKRLLEEPLSSPEHIVLVEWPDRLFTDKQPDFPHWRLTFSHGEGPNERVVTVERA